jgi:hypothetical protein
MNSYLENALSKIDTSLPACRPSKWGIALDLFSQRNLHSLPDYIKLMLHDYVGYEEADCCAQLIIRPSRRYGYKLVLDMVEEPNLRLDYVSQATVNQLIMDNQGRWYDGHHRQL